MIATRVILFGIVAAQLADAITFTAGVMRYGIGIESNGVIGGLYQLAGLNGVLAVKLGALLIVLAVLVATSARYKRLFVWAGAAATSIGLLGFIANAWSMAILAG